jgi:hypothetical protein
MNYKLISHLNYSIRNYCIILLTSGMLCCIGNLNENRILLSYRKHISLEQVKNSFLMIYLIDTESEKKEQKNRSASGVLYLSEYDEEINENAKVRLMPIPFQRQETIFQSRHLKNTPKVFKGGYLVPGCNHIFPFPVGERILDLYLSEIPPDGYQGVIYPFQRMIPLHLKENETAILEVNLVTHANEMKVIKTPERIMDQICK